MDTSHARSAILERIRRARGASPAQRDSERASAEQYIAQHPLAPKPTVGEDAVAHFLTQAQRQSCTSERVATSADVPAAIAGFLQANGLGNTLICWPLLAGLPWAAAGLQVDARAPKGDDLVGVSGVFAAVAETGTLVMLSGPDSPASTHLLPETHIAVIPASRVVRHYEDAFARVRSERGQTPRAMNLVSGPSRTGDIEQTIVLGAHGPYRVHLVVVDGE